MFHKKLTEIRPDDLETLVIEQRLESRTLEYKRDLNFVRDENKKELARDVSSFANADGGDLIFGVNEARDANGTNLGYPDAIVGIDCANFEELRQRLENFLGDAIDPPIPGVEIHQVARSDQRPVVILRIPRSWVGPHMVTVKSTTPFYSRGNSGKRPLDVRDIRTAFIASHEATDRVLRFVGHRASLIQANEMPVGFHLAHPVSLVIHVIPVSFTGQILLDTATMRGAGLTSPTPGNASRFNLDGFIEYSTETSYSLLFRSGVVESVVCYNADGTEPRQIYGLAVEKEAFQTIGMSIKTLRKCGIQSPLSVHIEMGAMKGVRIANTLNDRHHELQRSVDRDILVLPHLLLEDDSTDLTQQLRPIFDALWQSSGWDRSYGYDEKGAWNKSKHDNI
jgi:hypothetical protein